MRLSKLNWSRSSLMAMFVIVTAVTVVYAPLFGGYWLSDDFSNLGIAYNLANQGNLLRGTLDYFLMGTSSAGSMYRPLQMVSLLGNYAISGANYPAWFAFNFTLHLLSTILVFYVVRVFTARLDKETRRVYYLSPLFAALAFALAPSLAEGVFFISARADALVTFLSLLCLLAWAHSMKTNQEHKAWWFPVLLAPALLIKESAAVLPLQILLVAVAHWSALRRQHFLALTASAILLCGFFVLRWLLFGHIFGVYSAPGDMEDALTLSALWHAILSLGPWWHALTQGTPAYATLYLWLMGATLLWSLLNLRGPYAALVLALLCAAGGLALATLLNLNGFPPSGEGGRLSYGPVCWFLLAIGVAMSGAERVKKTRWLAPGLLAASIISGGFVLQFIISQVRDAQMTTWGIANSVREWSATNGGHAILFIPEMTGFVVTTRNALAGLVMPPVQNNGLLHRLLPTHENDAADRYKLYKNGLATSLLNDPPVQLDALTTEKLLKPDVSKWPDFYLCWSPEKKEMLLLDTPRVTTIDAWTEDLLISLVTTCHQDALSVDLSSQDGS